MASIQDGLRIDLFRQRAIDINNFNISPGGIMTRGTTKNGKIVYVFLAPTHSPAVLATTVSGPSGSGISSGSAASSGAASGSMVVNTVATVSSGSGSGSTSGSAITTTEVKDSVEFTGNTLIWKKDASVQVIYDNVIRAQGTPSTTKTTKTFNLKNLLKNPGDRLHLVASAKGLNDSPRVIFSYNSADGAEEDICYIDSHAKIIMDIAMTPDYQLNNGHQYYDRDQAVVVNKKYTCIAKFLAEDNNNYFTATRTLLTKPVLDNINMTISLGTAPSALVFGYVVSESNLVDYN